MRLLVWVLILVACCVVWTWWPSEDLDVMAREGLIDQKAPVKAVLDETIEAPVDKVWGLIANANDCPRWHWAISDSSMAGPIAAGTLFTWKMSGNEIHSKLVVVNAPLELVWTGKATGARAIHLWKLRGLPDGRTQVHVEESMDGALLRFFYSSKDLAESDQG